MRASPADALCRMDRKNRATGTISRIEARKYLLVAVGLASEVLEATLASEEEVRRVTPAACADEEDQESDQGDRQHEPSTRSADGAAPASGGSGSRDESKLAGGVR